MLQERHQRRGHGDDLLGRDVHVADIGRFLERELALEAAWDEFVDELALGVQFGIGLGDHEIALLDR